MDINILAEQLSNLTVLECYQLAKIMEKEYGIKPSTQVMGVNVSPVPTVNVEVEKTSFNVNLKSIGQANKLQLVKTVKEMMGNSLMEAKTLVDNVPSMLKENATKDEASALEKALKELGAEIEVL